MWQVIDPSLTHKDTLPGTSAAGFHKNNSEQFFPVHAGTGFGLWHAFMEIILVARVSLILALLAASLGSAGAAGLSSQTVQQGWPASVLLAQAEAADETAPETSGAHHMAEDDGQGLRLPLLETAREKVYNATEWAARGIDSWFGDKPFEDGGRISQGRLGLRTLWRQDNGFDFNLRFRVRMELPNARDRAYLIIGRENERELVTDKPDAFSRQQQLLSEDRNQDDTFFAGLGVALRDSIDLRVGVRGGYKIYTQARYTKEWMLSERDRTEFRETIFWTVSEGFGSTTSFDYEHFYSPSLAFRWLNSGTVSEKTDGFAWSSSAGMYKAFGDDKLLSAEALVNGETGIGVGVREYGVRIKWQQPVYRDWLIGELVFGHFWPRKDEYSERDSSWAIGGGLEMRF